MPKRQPDQVITLRVEAGEYERQNILKPVAEIGQLANTVKSVGALAGGLALVAGAYAVWTLWDTFGEAGQKLDAMANNDYVRNSQVGPFKTFLNLWKIV